jgi:GNAT superfamily N-acetyltransferase
MVAIQVHEVASRRDMKAFVKFPWRVYRGDPNWVPPLISERLSYLDPAHNPFYEHAEVALFLARRGREAVGTLAAFVDHAANRHQGRRTGGFGFFEVVDEYAVAGRLLDTACGWVKARGMAVLRGPTNFTNNDAPGVLIAGADCPPVMLSAHTPPYYPAFLERYGMRKSLDVYAWRFFRRQAGEELEGLPPKLLRVAEAARRRGGVTVRKGRLDDWETEMETARCLFNATLAHLSDHVPLTRDEFRRMAGQVRPFLDPELVLFAEAGGRPAGFCVAIPDLNRVLIHLDGRLFPLGWLKAWWYGRRIDVVSFKLMGVLEEYRLRGVEALLYVEIARAVLAGGYRWLDGSLTSEENTAINTLVRRLGAERYKHYRIYEMPV